MWFSFDNQHLFNKDALSMNISTDLPFLEFWNFHVIKLVRSTLFLSPSIYLSFFFSLFHLLPLFFQNTGSFRCFELGLFTFFFVFFSSNLVFHLYLPKLDFFESFYQFTYSFFFLSLYLACDLPLSLPRSPIFREYKFLTVIRIRNSNVIGVKSCYITVYSRIIFWSNHTNR